jgi:hypothetical protein
MNERRQSLLLRAQNGEANAWTDLTDLYRPLILGWLKRQGVPARDLEDLSQDVLVSVVKHLPGFEHSGHRGWSGQLICPGGRAAGIAGLSADEGIGPRGIQGLPSLRDPDSKLSGPPRVCRRMFVAHRQMPIFAMPPFSLPVSTRLLVIIKNEYVLMIRLILSVTVTPPAPLITAPPTSVATTTAATAAASGGSLLGFVNS